MKKLISIMITVLALSSLAGCERPDFLGGAKEKYPEPIEGTVYSVSDIYRLAPEEVEAFFLSDEHEKYIAALSKQAQLYKEVYHPDENNFESTEGGIPFDTDTKWDEGVVYIDLSQYDDGSDDDEDDESFGDPIPAPFDKYFPGMKGSVMKIPFSGPMITIECSKDTLYEILSRMENDGYEFMTVSDAEGILILQGGSEAASMAVQVTWSESSCLFMFTEIPKE